MRRWRGAQLHRRHVQLQRGDGRCPTCGGSGFEHVEMQFLSDVYLRCPDCDGKRFRAEMLEVIELPRGADRGTLSVNVADVLDLTVSEAVRCVRAGDRDVIAKLQPIVDVGLEYVKLGQPVPTLSGGEAQRLKLAGFLAEAAKSSASAPGAARRRARCSCSTSRPPACISTTSPS